MRYGRPSATDEEVDQALRAADAESFADERGTDAAVGQRGRLLSGGQRQRVAIARALLRNAPVLVLDEPTTGLDPGSADRIGEPIRRLMAGRTTIVISHNLRLVRDADLIVVLDHGRVVQQGKHDDLVTRPGTYRDLYDASVIER